MADQDKSADNGSVKIKCKERSTARMMEEDSTRPDNCINLYCDKPEDHEGNHKMVFKADGKHMSGVELQMRVACDWNVLDQKSIEAAKTAK